MEAVPRLPMISFHLKVSPEPATFGPKLKQYIREFYNEDAESYTNEIHQLENLRAMAVRPPIDMAGCQLLKKYYCQLHFLQSRFPMGKDGAAAITFTWRDTYANMICSLGNIRFEIISILYNIGAMHTQLGAKTERTTADGMKMACAHFQCAAWAFEHLKNSYPQPSGVDLAPELMTFMHQLCLAQAQECILEKSMLDNRKPTIVAKVARQIVDYFTLALNTLDQGGSEDGTVSDTVGTKIYKNWRRYVKFKRCYHLAVTHLYQGLAAEEQRKMGERVAFYNAALACLNDAHAIYSNAKGNIGITGAAEEKSAVEEALTFTNDVIEGKRKAAKNENEFIYHEEVPEKDSLPTVKGASLVKGISFSINDSEVSGSDIFARLVPMKVHEASSLYSEEKAKILRTMGAKIEEKDQQLTTYLTSLKLEQFSLVDPEVQISDWERLPLPESLVERCAALNAKPHVIQELVDIMKKLTDTSQDVETILKEIKELLQEEERKEKEYQDAVGKRPPSIVATDLTREAKKYEEAHNKALESNQALQKAITTHVKGLKRLAQPLADLFKYIPSPTNLLLEQNPTNEAHKAHVKELKRILCKMDEMKRQREDLHSKLRDSIAQDDLTRLLVTATSDSGPLDRLFADQLAKHQSLVNLIDQNLAAQDKILGALTDAYAQTAELRKAVEDKLKRRNRLITALTTAYDTYEDMLAKSTKGLEFYRKLEINVSKLLQRVKSTCKVQEEEREQILAQDNKNTHEEPPNAAVSSVQYEQQESTRNGGTLKLKDYLNSRTDSASGHQNQYYGLYKGQQHGGGVQSESYPTSKQCTADSVLGTVQPSASISIPEASYGSITPMQQCYSTFTDAKINSTYPYGTQVYGESIVTSSIGQTYQQPSMQDTTSVYHHSTVSTTIPDHTSRTSQYPGRYSSAEQTYSDTVIDGQDKYYKPTQPQYNYNNIVQYDAYQVPTSYTRSNMTQQDQIYTTLGHQYQGPTSHAKNTTSVSEIELTNQVQMMTINVTSGDSVINAGNSNNNKVDGQHYPSTQHPSTQHPTEPQQATSSSQDVHRAEYAGMQNHVQQGYQFPQSEQNAVYAQNYQSTMTYGVPIQQTSQIGSTYNSGYGTTNTATATQYMPIQGDSAVTYSTHHPGSVMASTTDTSQVSIANPAYVTPDSKQYAQQQTYSEQEKQNYDQSYLSYNVHDTVHDTVGMSYSNAYQGYQHPSGNVPYQTSSTTSGTSNNYPYTGTQMIQSHANSTTVQNYSQSYQYPHHGSYSTYVPEYSQAGYNATYPYVQGTQVVAAAASAAAASAASAAAASAAATATATTIGEMYKDQSVYTPVQNYAYSSTGATMPVIAQVSQPYPMATQQAEATMNSTYPYQESNARYTNASNSETVSQTPSSQYSNQTYQTPAVADNYYTMQYGLQMQGVSTAGKQENQTNYSQTYMQAESNGTSTTTSAEPPKPSTSSFEETSNVDLLSDLDVNINHAPLVPEVRPLNKGQKEEDCCQKVPDVDGKEEEEEEDKADNENLQIVWDTWYNDVQPKKDPLGDPTILQKFITDVEKYEKFVDSLLVKTLSGATNLDIKWKEVQGFEERENGKQSSTVAMAHSSENRTVDCIPYDTTRVQILSTNASSTYINASHVTEITQFIPTAFIITQTPLPDKADLFWTMVWEQESEVIACLATDAQLNGEIYWTTSEKEKLTIGNFTISLIRIVTHPTYVQRIFNLCHANKKGERTVVHMQYLAWPSNGFPSSPGGLLAFSTDVMTEQALRRCSPKPVIIHCLDGGSLSSLFLLAAATVCHIRAGCGIVDVPLVFKGLIKCRKQVVNKESLLFAYRMVLYHAQDILMKRGILSSTRSTFENFDVLKGNRDKTMKRIHCHPSDDFLHNFGTNSHRSDTEQLGDVQMASVSNSTVHTSIQDKTKVTTVDPLSQLDPMWSIRR